MTQPFTFRLVATDVDGTLVNSNKFIPKFTKSELRRVARDYDARLVLVSARMPRSLVRVGDELGIDCSLIAYNGALIIPFREGPPLSSVAMEEKIVSVLIRELLPLNLHIGAFSHDQWFVSDADYWTLREARGTGIWPNRKRLKEAMAEGEILSAHKIMVRGEARVVREAIRAVEFLQLDVGISRDSRATAVEFTNSSISKGAALRTLLEHFNVPASSVIAFGDGYSDISMLKLAGKGIAVDNSPGEVCASVDDITLSNDEDGVGYALRKYFPTDACIPPSDD